MMKIIIKTIITVLLFIWLNILPNNYALILFIISLSSLLLSIRKLK